MTTNTLIDDSLLIALPLTKRVLIWVHLIEGAVAEAAAAFRVDKVLMAIEQLIRY